MIRLKDILSEELNEAGYPEDLSFEEFVDYVYQNKEKIDIIFEKFYEYLNINSDES